MVHWLLGSKFALMEDLLPMVERAPMAEEAVHVRGEIRRLLVRAQRVLAVRLAVTVLLAIGLATTAVATITNLVVVPDALDPGVAVTRRLLDRIAASAASATVVLVLIRFAADRVLGLLETRVTFFTIRLARLTAG